MRRDLRPARAKGARRALAVHAQAHGAAAHGVLLDLGDVVAHVIEHFQVRGRQLAGQHALERPPHEVRDDLAVGPGIVGGARHGGQVLPPLGRVQRRAHQLPVGQGDAVLGRGLLHQPHIVAAHLVAKATRPAVDPDGDAPRHQAKGAGYPRVVHLDDLIHLEKVVARPEGAELVAPALLRPRAHGRGVGLRHAPPVLGVLHIARRALAGAHGPFGALLQHAAQIIVRQACASRRPDPRGYRGVQGAHHVLHVRADCLRLNRRGQQAHAAVDVVPHPARRDDAVGERRGRHATDGKAVALVHVWHRHGMAHDPRKRRGVDELLYRAIGQGRVEDSLVGIDAPRHAHVPAPPLGHLPEVGR